MRQRGPLLLEQPDAGRNIFLLRLVEPVPPILEDIRELDVPFHALNIAVMEYASRTKADVPAIPGSSERMAPCRSPAECEWRPIKVPIDRQKLHRAPRRQPKRAQSYRR